MMTRKATLSLIELPCSVAQATKIGKALRDDTLTPEQNDTLDRLLACYGTALAYVMETLTSLGLTTEGRIKQIPPLAEKLRRHRDSGRQLPLLAIDDVAGARVVIEEQSRRAQDQVVQRIVDAFAADGTDSPDPNVKDRRIKPSYGYRAVHVIIRVDQLRVEVQVRTPLQHEWAELSEKSASVFGRGIKYGATPAILPGEGYPGEVGRELVEVLDAMSDSIRLMEEVQDGTRVRLPRQGLPPALGSAWSRWRTRWDLRKLEWDLRSQMQLVSDLLDLVTKRSHRDPR